MGTRWFGQVQKEAAAAREKTADESGGGCWGWNSTGRQVDGRESKGEVLMDGVEEHMKSAGVK